MAAVLTPWLWCRRRALPGSGAGRRPWLALAALFAALFAVLSPALAHAERVEDIASIGGVRSNELVGYGLVVGLDGTGDQTTQAPFTVQSIANMLAKFGVTVPATVAAQMQLKNVAAVTVTAQLPPFSKAGQTIDVNVASIGNATSLRGGSLLMTPLRGADGDVYALAQGNVLVNGFGVKGRDGSRVTVNIPSGGRIPNGATVERSVPTSFDSEPYILLNLDTPDFTTAARLSRSINALLGDDTAQAIDAVTVKVRAPADPAQRVAFVSTLERIHIDPGQPPARVIVNSRTGTIVIGAQVRVMPVAVAHGSLEVTIREHSDVSQPNPLSGGATVVTPRSQISVKQRNGRMFLFQPGVSLEQLVHAVNKVGATPGDLVAILEALEQAGALHAQLIVI